MKGWQLITAAAIVAYGLISAANIIARNNHICNRYEFVNQMVFDKADGSLTIYDVNQNKFKEIDYRSHVVSESKAYTMNL